ncbi:glycosyltransferase family 4 protein [candidate division KSB1 bacterium]|nr:glycosyltransferase family 4 protein [candidate division KSB1 bacterium]
MKIGMLLESSFPPDLRVENEMRTLAEAGHEIVLFCLSHSMDKRDEYFSDHIFLRRKYISKSLFNKIRITILRWPFYPGHWIRFVNQEKGLEAIHVHDLPLARIGVAIAKKYRIPFVLDLHENYPAAIRIWGHYRSLPGRYFYADKAWRRYEKRSVQQANHVIVVVDEAKARLVKQGFEANKISVVSNTLNLAEIKTTELPAILSKSDELHLTYFGGLGVHRGLEIAIQGMPEIIKANPSVKLHIYGDGKDRPNLERLAKKFAVEAHVIFEGWQKVKDVNDALQVMRHSDICLVPYLSTEHTETTVPHKLFQYMYLKKPVLVSSCAPLQRIIRETGAGEVFQADDSHDFARGVIHLFDEKVRERAGECGHRAVVEKYNWQREAKKLLLIYEKMNK